MKSISVKGSILFWVGLVSLVLIKVNVWFAVTALVGLGFGFMIILTDLKEYNRVKKEREQFEIEKELGVEIGNE